MSFKPLIPYGKNWYLPAINKVTSFMAFKAKTMLVRRQVKPNSSKHPLHKRMYQHRRRSAPGINDSSIYSRLNTTLITLF